MIEIVSKNYILHIVLSFLKFSIDHWTPAVWQLSLTYLYSGVICDLLDQPDNSEISLLLKKYLG